MTVFQAAVLGAVQGLTEFIPISSSGHLVIVPKLLGWEQPSVAFDVLLHTASLLALLVYFSGDLLDLARGLGGRDRDSVRLLGLLIVGTLPAAAAGFFLRDYFTESFEDAAGAALQLLITALILVAAEQALRYHERKRVREGSRLRRMRDMQIGDAGVIGVGQAISIWPGISRSGATIGAGLALALARDDAARFAFLLAIPALLGATILELPELGRASLSMSAGTAGFLVSLLTSYGAIWGLIRYLKTRTLYPFAAYCVVAGPVFYALV